jgi:uncharacterized protein
MKRVQSTSASIRTFCCTLAAVYLAGCSLQPPTRPDAGTHPVEARAEAAEQAGDLALAARLYTDLAAGARGVQRSDYLLRAARIAIQLGDLETARSQLDAARRDADRDQQQLLALLLADVALREHRPQEALDTLDTVRPPVPISLSSDLAGLRGQALFGVGRPAEAVAVLVERELWLDRGADVIANQRLIWDGLVTLGLSEPPELTGDPVIDGWLALAPAASLARGGLREARAALLEWRAVHTTHPAAAGLLAEMLGEPMVPIDLFPRRIALLLPLGAAQRPAAIAIRDGFMAAHLAAGDTGLPATVRIYDTAGVGATEAYRQAQLDGADFIVGPLLRPDVEAVAAEAGFVPTLALNSSREEMIFLPRFYQFALDPEDEARAVARRAIASGARTAVGLIPLRPGDPWGDRLLSAFRTEFESLGGRLTGFERYDAASGDFVGPITSLLNINRSLQRRERLSANLGARLEFQPRLRQDVDMIFLAADAATARLLVPQLRYHDAGHIPTYATSEVYEPARGRDRDLDGVSFPDAPWLLAPNDTALELRRELENYWPQRTTDGFMIRLYAMGYDAYHLIGRLYGAGGGFAPFDGMSGELVLGGDGRIHRLLPFAQFRSGRPVRLQPSPSEGGVTFGSIRP